MKKLLLIEWDKIKSYRAFWIIISLYLFLLIVTVAGLPAFLHYITDKTNASVFMKLFTHLLLSFPDVWQNIAFFAGNRAFIKLLLAILIIILVSNEFTYHTVRMNIISGLSRYQFLLAKVELILALSLLSTIILFLSGLYVGFENSRTITLQSVLGNLYFLPAYFTELFTYLSFALMIGVIIRKTGFAIITLLIYLVVEPIIQYYLPDQFDKYLPMNAMNHIVWSVNTSDLTFRTPEFNISLQQNISASDVIVCIGYAAVFLTLVWLSLQKKDL